jgi:hypothetical protein
MSGQLHGRVRAALVALSLGLTASAAPGVSDAAVVWGSDALDTLTGSRSSVTGGGVTGTQNWDEGGFAINWNVTESAGLWTYTYTVSVTGGIGQVKDVSHFLLEVTDDDQPFDILNGTSAPLEGPQVYSGAQPGNPQMPNPLYGVKFDFGSEDGTVVYTIVTDRSPVWGVFYARDGKAGGQDVVAYADALAYADYMTNATLGTGSFIVRPDGAGIAPDPVPLPAALWLLISGLASLGAAARPRRT